MPLPARTPLFLAVAALVIVGAPGLAQADVRIYDAGDPEHPKTLDAYGWVQPRFSWQQSDKRPGIDFDPNPGFTLQRVRLGFVANIETWIRGQVELELGGQQQTPLMDAFVVASPIPEVAFTAGQFRVPFSRQNLLASKTFQFADTAYFVTPKWVVDRDMGAMISGSLFEGRARYFLGVFDGNEPGRGQTSNTDPYMLYAGRLEISPLGAPPRFEGDLRPLAERRSFIVTLGGGAMRNHVDDKHYQRTHVGADLGLWFMGASLYAEYYKRTDRADAPNDPHIVNQAPSVTSEGFNVQVGYFPPAPWVEEHLELAARVEAFDPNKEVPHPGIGAGLRDLDQATPQWGYRGYLLGVNVFPTKVHEVKLQASYEIRNETKKCLDGQSGAACTGYIRNNLFVAQATVAFLVAPNHYPSPRQTNDEDPARRARNLRRSRRRRARPDGRLSEHGQRPSGHRGCGGKRRRGPGGRARRRWRGRLARRGGRDGVRISAASADGIHGLQTG